MRQEHGYRRRHVLAHRRSGVTRTAYCLYHGLHPETFRTWCRRLEVEGDLACWPAGPLARWPAGRG